MNHRRPSRMRSFIGVVALAVLLGACGNAASAPATAQQSQPSSPSAAVQRVVCGSVPDTTCRAIVAKVIDSVPGMAASPLAVVDFGGDQVKAGYGGDAPVLVAFQPVGDEDLWMNPPTWVYVSHDSGAFFLIEEWRLGTLPANFMSLLRTAGLSS